MKLKNLFTGKMLVVSIVAILCIVCGIVALICVNKSATNDVLSNSAMNEQGVVNAVTTYDYTFGESMDCIIENKVAKVIVTTIDVTDDVLCMQYEFTNKSESDMTYYDLMSIVVRDDNNVADGHVYVSFGDISESDDVTMIIPKNTTVDVTVYGDIKDISKDFVINGYLSGTTVYFSQE